MKKAHFTALGKVFANEIQQAAKPPTWPRFPFQSRSQVFDELAQMGLVVRRNVLCGQGAFRVNVTGWELSPLGHRAYCEACKDVPALSAIKQAEGA
jgi:hypothetical protein